MSVVLISLQEGIENLGLKFVHYALLEDGIESSILFLPKFDADAVPSSVADEVCAFVADKAPLFVGINLMSCNFLHARALTLRLKERLPGTPVIWGGTHPTIAPEDCVDCADYACVGEGERVVVEVARRLKEGRSIDDVPSLARRAEDGSLRRNPLQNLVQALDTLPYFEHRPRNGYILHEGRVTALDGDVFRRHAIQRGTSYVLMASRGCPYSCTYCCNNVFNELTGSRKVRRRGPENIVADIERAVRDNPNIGMIYFMDDCFCAARTEELKRFAEIYKERIGLPFAVKTIASYITPEKLAVLKAGGMTSVSMGLQSGSERVLKEVYGRKVLPERIIETVGMLTEQKLFVEIDVIFDNPFEREEDRILTIEALARMPKPYFLQLFSLTPYYGTEIYNRMLAEMPEALEESKTKNYLRLKRTPLNRLAFLAPYISREMTFRILDIYRREPDGWKLKAALALGQLITAAAMPVALGRMYVRIRGNSLPRAAREFSSHVGYFLSRFRHNLVSGYLQKHAATTAQKTE